jgi:protein-S-isoprenylcysteine O-methyltransferase Ste14
MADIRQLIFRNRSFTPIPFLLLMIVFAEPTPWTLVGGALLALAGEGIRFWGVAYAGPLTRVTGNVGAPELMTSGPFAYTRNPLYVGNMMLYAGIAVMSHALVPWILLATLVFFGLQYAAIVSLEEEFLAKQFGERYKQYRNTVPRFLPVLRPARVGQESQRPDWAGARRSERRTFQGIAIVGTLVIVRWLWI